MTIARLPSDIKVGDELILATGSRYRGDEPVTVARLGRKYLYINRNGREYGTRFHRDTGAEDSNYSAHEQLYTPAQYEENKQRNALFEQLRKAGIDVAYRVQGGLATDQLRALLAIVTSDA